MSNSRVKIEPTTPEPTRLDSTRLVLLFVTHHSTSNKKPPKFPFNFVNPNFQFHSINFFPLSSIQSHLSVSHRRRRRHRRRHRRSRRRLS
ncbi:hypothetical protein vseg_019550 [Gypsophila vaccaria]